MKIGIALSGGGARGIAHLGVLKALEEKGIRPHMITGTSAGALAGAFYAAGLTPEQILDIITQTSFLRALRPAINLRGLLKIDLIQALFRRHMPVETFEGLDIKLIVATTDLTYGELVYFSSGDLIRPVAASTCIPGLFAPVELNGHCLIDGGVLNNMPVEPLVGHNDFIIGVHTNCYPERPEIRSLRSTIERSFQLAINDNVRERIPLCNLFIEPPELSRFTIFDLKRAHEIFTIGYEYAKELPALEMIGQRLAS